MMNNPQNLTVKVASEKDVIVNLPPEDSQEKLLKTRRREKLITGIIVGTILCSVTALLVYVMVSPRYQQSNPSTKTVVSFVTGLFAVASIVAFSRTLD